MSTAQGSAVSGGQRALAWLSIGCAAVLTVVLVIFSVRNLAALVAVVVGVAVAGAGGWWLITEHPPRRWVGLAGAVVGLASSSLLCWPRQTVTGRWSVWRWCWSCSR